MAPDSDSDCIKTLLKEISILGQGRRKLVVAGPWPITKDHSCGSWYKRTIPTQEAGLRLKLVFLGGFPIG